MLLEEFQFKYINARAGELGRTPIHQVIAMGNIEVVKLLVEHGADTFVETFGRTILHVLASNEEEDYFILCLQTLEPSSRSGLNALAKLEDTPEGLTALELAVNSSHLKVAELPSFTLALTL